MRAEWPGPDCKLFYILPDIIDNFKFQCNNYKKTSLDFTKSKIERGIL